MRNFLLSIGFVLLLFGSGCDIFDRPEPLPVYLNLPRAEVRLNASGSIKSELGIKDLWVDYGPGQLGVFRLPSVVPLLPLDGVDSVVVRGGIFESGLSLVRSPYPFWKPIILSLTTAPADTQRISPVFEYYPDTVIAFPFVEDFESASQAFENVSSSSTTTSLTVSSESVFMGQESGKVSFSPDQYQLDLIAADFIRLPQSGSNDIYMEITYKNDVSFTVGLFYSTGLDVGEIPAELYFNSKGEWNTVFVHLNDGVRSVQDGAFFKPYIRASSFNTSTGQATSGVIYLDNIRIVHFR
ncbi:MAG: hypothetical protein SF052_07910 [Bacteroidia bacterium]|nr:hypothetical protein [Bacteroidia bacterium]